MNPLNEELITIIRSSSMKDERKRLLISYCEKNDITKDFFEMLSANIIEDAKERKGAFMESVEEWSTIYSSLMEELRKEGDENSEILSQKLSNAGMWDSDVKQLALRKYSNQQTALYQKYQKKIASLGIQYIERVFQKIQSHQNV